MEIKKTITTGAVYLLNAIDVSQIPSRLAIPESMMKFFLKRHSAPKDQFRDISYDFSGVNIFESGEVKGTHMDFIAEIKILQEMANEIERLKNQLLTQPLTLQEISAIKQVIDNKLKKIDEIRKRLLSYYKILYGYDIKYGSLPPVIRK